MYHRSLFSLSLFFLKTILVLMLGVYKMTDDRQCPELNVWR
jgi:hypothetical protein